MFELSLIFLPECQTLKLLYFISININRMLLCIRNYLVFITVGGTSNNTIYYDVHPMVMKFGLGDGNLTAIHEKLSELQK